MEPIQYTDKTAVENYLIKTIDDSFDAQLTEWIEAMSLLIDSMANRTIFRETPETFKYDGDGTRLILIKDCVDITAVTVDGIDLTSEIVKYPANKGYTSRIALPDRIFTKGMQNVSVTAIQAMNKVLPADIKTACTILVAGILNNQTLKGQARTEQIGNYSVTYMNDQQEKDFVMAKSIIASYRRIVI